MSTKYIPNPAADAYRQYLRGENIDFGAVILAEGERHEKAIRKLISPELSINV